MKLELEIEEDAADLIIKQQLLQHAEWCVEFGNIKDAKALVKAYNFFSTPSQHIKLKDLQQ